MTTKSTNSKPFSVPIAGAVLIGFFSALIVGFSFEVIKHWPVPASVVPAFGFNGGLWWGAVSGGFMGLILGYLVDEKHFNTESNQ